MNDERIEKLVEIAKMYYQEGKTQSEIAVRFGISRPLISRMLSEAREYGIVRIEICSPLNGNSLIINQLRNFFNIDGGVAVPNTPSDRLTNDSIARCALQYIIELNGGSVGIGWGTIIGSMVSIMDINEEKYKSIEKICPLIGNSSVSSRNYHSNENVRIFAEKAIATPIYLHAPAFVETEQEVVAIKSLENYKAVAKAWEELSIAVVNIGNYPDVPDYAPAVRKDDVLNEKKAAGRLLSYYYTLDGEVIRLQNDFTVQMPIESLARCKNVIGICSNNVKPQALVGALRTGLVSHVIASEDLIKTAMDYK